MAEISAAFTQAMMSLLDTLKSFTGNYGWAIVIFGLLIKLALYYPTHLQYKSMKEMSKIQPLMKGLQEKYKDDPQKLQMEQMALFKEHKVNPLGGCLPILIQMPILIGIFMTIKKMAELNKFTGETFLWIGSSISHLYPKYLGTSLAEKDIPLLILYGLSMYLSQKMTVTDPATEKSQKMMNTIMPVFFTFILWQFPSSLILYWLVFNIGSIIQQYFVMRDKTGLVPAAPGAAQVAPLKEGTGPETSPSIKHSRSRKKKGGK